MNLFAFIGNDELSKQEALSSTLKKWLGSGIEDPLCKETFFCEESSWDTIAESFDTVSMFTEKKAIIIKNIEKMDVSKQRLLSQSLKHPNELTGAFITGEKWDGRSVLKALFKKSGLIKEFKLPYSSQIPKWLCSRCIQKFKRKISFQDAKFLWECIGDSLEELEAELIKLDQYLPEGAPILMKDIENLVFPHRDRNIFEFQNSMGLKQKSQALISLSHLLENGEPAFLIAMRLFSHFQQLLKIRVLADAGKSNDDIIKLLHLIPYHFNNQNYARQAYSRSVLEWKKLLANLAEIELQGKKGKYTFNFEIETALAAMC